MVDVEPVCDHDAAHARKTEAAFYEFDQFERLVEASDRESQTSWSSVGRRGGTPAWDDRTRMDRPTWSKRAARSEWRVTDRPLKGGRIRYVP
jgi:hypothetical protein